MTSVVCESRRVNKSWLVIGDETSLDKLLLNFAAFEFGSNADLIIVHILNFGWCVASENLNKQQPTDPACAAHGLRYASVCDRFVVRP